jgi:cell division septal protein FtsQ
MSWFDRRPKNRRLGRQHVLDVKLRSSQVRAARARMAAIGMGSFFAVLLGVYLLWCAGEWALDEFVYRNRAFAIERIDLDTDGILSREQLQRWAGVKLQDNLLAVDLARVQRDLKLVSSIESVSVERVLPHTLCIRVVEREPVAEVRAARPRPSGGIELTTYEVDGEGYVMLPPEPAYRAPGAVPPSDLPQLKGVDPNELQPGRRLQSVQTDAALALVVAFERSPMAGLVDLKQIDISAADALLVTTGQGSLVTFGLTDLEQRLRRWRKIFDAAQKTGKLIGTLDLAVTNNIPLAFLEASASPPSPKAVKPPRTRKKHV